MAPKEQLSLKKQCSLGRWQADSRAAQGNIQGQPGTFCCARKQGWKDDRDMSKGQRGQLEGATDGL